ncbi:MAG TPA: VWA domain-containing protein [Thermoanaerobaculia bacterium]|nr:VWA domain-containing protein [Thermoanaerobaculia bacterium]
MNVPARLIPLLVLAVALPLAAQPAPEGADLEVGESIDVRVVNVEAVVTDSHGQHIKGLNSASFRLLVDGKEVPIDYFTEIRSGSAVAAGGEGPAAPVTGTVGRNVLVFIDQSYSVQAQLALVLRRLEKDLAGLGPEDQVALVAADGEGHLKILTGWTSDASRLHTVLDQVRRQPTDGAQLRVALDRIESDRILRNSVDNTGALGDPTSLSGSEEGHWWDLREATQPGRLSTLERYSVVERGEASLFADDSFGMTVLAAMRAFSSAPGRKVLLLYSGGWPAGVEPRVTEGANLLGYSIYPVDVSGLQTPPVRVNADRFDYAELGSYSDRNTFITSSWERRVEYGFEVLARDTGGKASLNGLRETALARTLDDTSSYYWLGFSPTWKADGSKHDIRLEMRGSGLHVRARRSYSDLSLKAQQALEAASRKVIAAAGTGTR